MTKILVILLIVALGLYLLYQYMKRKLIKMFNIPVDAQERMKRETYRKSNTKSDDDVIYDKDDVVVMKGEAKDTRDKK